MNDLTTLIRRAQQIADASFAKETADLTPRQYAVLRAVAEHPGCSQNDAIATTGIDRSTLSDIVRRLIRRQMLKRGRDKRDARAYALSVTEYGQRFLDAGNTASILVEARLMRCIPATHRRVFMTALAALSAPREAAE